MFIILILFYLVHREIFLTFYSHYIGIPIYEANNITMIDIIIYLGTAQGIILSLILLTTRRGNIYANRILGIKILLFTVVIFTFLFRPGELTDICFLCIVIQHIFLIISPFIYLYTAALTNPEVKIKPKYIYNFIPFFLSIAAYLIYYFLISGTLNSREMIISLGNFAQIMVFFIVLVMMTFLILSFMIIKQYKKTIKNIFSSLQSINLQWLQWVLIGYAVILILVIILQFLGNGYYIWGMICILLSFFFYFTGYMGLRQPEIFSGFSPSIIVNNNSTKKKYEKSALTGDKSEDYLSKLMELINREKIYLESEINLPMLASRLNISPNHLSQIINERLKKNFFDFINYYRVEESKKMLSSEKYSHFNILAIGLEAGFNSNTTFISAFKRYEKTTPSEYRKMKQV
jgi:AraC-like DNA-binding protein